MKEGIDVTKKVTAAERDALIRLNIAWLILSKEPEWLKERSRLVPFAARDLGMIKARIRKLLDAFEATVPDEQLKTYSNNLAMASYKIGVRRPGGEPRDDDNYGLWLSNRTIDGFQAMAHELCSMCVKNAAEQRVCFLRKTLDAVPNDALEHEGDGCPYYAGI